MRYCQNCGAQYDARSAYCPKCGTASNQSSNNGHVVGNGQVYAGDMYNQSNMMGNNQKYNVLAIVGLIFSFFVAPVGLILSIIALVQIKKTKEKGKGLAIAGLIISILQLLIIILVFVFVFVIFANVANNLELSTACANVDRNGYYETYGVEEGEDGYVICEDYECTYYSDGVKYTGSCSLFTEFDD